MSFSVRGSADHDLVLENPSSIPLIAGAYGILISIIVVYGVVNYGIERGFARPGDASDPARTGRLRATEQAVWKPTPARRELARRGARSDVDSPLVDPDLMPRRRLRGAGIPAARWPAIEPAQPVAPQDNLISRNLIHRPNTQMLSRWLRKMRSSARLAL